MQIRELAIDDVQIGERLRLADPDHVQLLAKSIAEHGQRTPIDVRVDAEGHFRLIAGLHRLGALRAAGIQTVQAIVHDVDDLTARLIEVDENLMRHELTALDRAAFLVERKAIYQAKYPDAKPGGKRPKGQKQAELLLTEGFARDVAKKLHLSRQWIDAAIRYHEKLTPAVRRRISGSRIADNARVLTEISKLTPSEQLVVVDELLRSGGAKTVQVAVLRLFQRQDKPVIKPRDAKYRRFIADWTMPFDELQGLREDVVSFLRREGYKISAPANKAR